MNTVDHVVTGFFKVKHSKGKAIPSGTLYSGLKDRATDNLVPAPLAGKGVLAVHSHTKLLLTPRSGEQLELWPLPADKPA